MADSLGYSSHLAAEAVAFVVSLPKRKQRVVLDLADQIAEHPFRICDYQSRDAAGHTVENLLVDAYLFTYWVAHATREVRITEIARV